MGIRGLDVIKNRRLFAALWSRVYSLSTLEVSVRMICCMRDNISTSGSLIYVASNTAAKNYMIGLCIEVDTHCQSVFV
jgi:hypothetical protein